MSLRHRNYLGEGIPSPGKVDLKNAVYSELAKVKGFNTLVSPVGTHAGETGGKILKKRLIGWTKDDHKQAVSQLVKMNKKIEQQYSNVLDAAAKETWGRSFETLDYKISCIGSDEFSEKYKSELRSICKKMSLIKGALASHKYLAGIR